MSATATATTTPRRHVPAPRPAARRRAELKVVGPPRHARRYVVASLLVGALGIFGVVSLSALAAEQAFTARGYEVEIDQLTARYEELTAEVAALESPARVRHVAAEQLGMVQATGRGYLIVERGGSSLGVRADDHSATLVTSHDQLADPLKPALAAHP